MLISCYSVKNGTRYITVYQSLHLARGHGWCWLNTGRGVELAFEQLGLAGDQAKTTFGFQTMTGRELCLAMSFQHWLCNHGIYIYGINIDYAIMVSICLAGGHGLNNDYIWQGCHTFKLVFTTFGRGSCYLTTGGHCLTMFGRGQWHLNVWQVIK